jgi:hypothetical protein
MAVINEAGDKPASGVMGMLNSCFPSAQSNNRMKLAWVIRSSLRYAQAVAHTPRSLSLVR